MLAVVDEPDFSPGLVELLELKAAAFSHGADDVGVLISLAGPEPFGGAIGS